MTPESHILWGPCVSTSRALLSVRWIRRLATSVVHLLLWSFAFFLALELRFEGNVPPAVFAASTPTLELLIILRLITFLHANLFDGLYRYSGFPELKKLIIASTAATAATFVASGILGCPGIPRSLFLGEWLISVVLIGGVRMIIRTLYEESRHSITGTPALIIGAGDAGESLVRELRRMRDGSAWKVVGFLDDDPFKHGRRVHQLPVFGPADEAMLRSVVKRHGVELVALAMPTADGARTRGLLRLCCSLGVRAKTVPSLAERLTGESLEAVREIAIEDLLRREPAKLDLDQVGAFLRDKVVLVTGAGGSIGSELCRQALRFEPSRLLLLDHDENAVFHIERELRELCGPDTLKPLIVDITDTRRIAWVFDHYRPEVVLHAAAHKHVAMMEANACEAARNNVFGTHGLAEAAHDSGAEAFVLISTDKAVNPTSVMGATKRVCEMAVQNIATNSRTRFAAVRFGNVLGSNGSVVPLFREQIARGGPVTVTHPDVTRYFMTIPEAAQLVLQAGALGGTGEVFLLDMGEPVKIVDLARDLIELSGLKPDIDIEIAFSGLKSGEKLFEEMLLAEECGGARPHPQIVLGKVQAPHSDRFKDGLEALGHAIRTNDEGELRRCLSRMVPEATLAVPLETDPSLRSLRLERKLHSQPLEQIDNTQMAAESRLRVY
jgi:FlaA1/EpsC-like NDP-sugar epimerase